MKTWLSQHAQALISSFGQMVRAPAASILTILVIAVSLALPLGLSIVVKNLDSLSSSYDGGRQISILLKPEYDEAAALDVLARLEQRADIARLELVSRDAAADELRDLLGVSDVTAGLDSNPIPVTLIVQPAKAWTTIEKVTELAADLKQLPEVGEVILDVVWLKRLESLAALIKRTALILALVLGLAVLLTVGNTIRLMVLGRAEEILVIDRVGGTSAFIRRPFLWTGLLQGLFGGLAALAVAGGALYALTARIEAVVASYEGELSLLGMGLPTALATVGAGALLGWLASWVAVSGHLRRLRPQ